MGGSSTTVQQGSSESTNEIPQWVQNAGQQNYGLAQQVASQPLQQFQGQQVASTSPQSQQAYNLAANSGSVGQDAQNAAQAGYLNTLGQTPAQVTAAQAQLASPVNAATAGNAAQSALANPVSAQQASTSQLANTNLSPYMNPYTQSVINATLPIMQQNLGLSQNQQQNAANSAGAFGGSRQAIQQGVTQAQGAMGMAQMAGQLNAANFAQAQQAGEFDVGQANQQAQFNAGQGNQVNLADMAAANNMGQFNAGQTNAQAQFNAAQQNQVGLANMAAANQMGQFNAGAQNTAAAGNQAAGLSQEQLANAASQGLGALGTQQMQNNVANYGMLTSAGGFEQQQQQNDINAQIAQFQQAWQYPQQQLGMMESSLGMTPYDTGTSGSSASTSTTTQSNPMAAALGGLQTLGGLFNPLAGMSNSLGGAIGGTSDRRLKTDITKVGVHKPTGIAMHSYRYKGDPKTYPKVVGPMAEDVEKHFPGSTMKIPGSGGKMAVHPGVLGALMTPPSSSGAQKAIDILKQPPQPFGALSPLGRPPSRGILSGGKLRAPGAPILGALGG
jgi:hypothetical protein